MAKSMSMRDCTMYEGKVKNMLKAKMPVSMKKQRAAKMQAAGRKMK